MIHNIDNNILTPLFSRVNYHELGSENTRITYGVSLSKCSLKFFSHAKSSEQKKGKKGNVSFKIAIKMTSVYGNRMLWRQRIMK